MNGFENMVGGRTVTPDDSKYPDKKELKGLYKETENESSVPNTLNTGYPDLTVVDDNGTKLIGYNTDDTTHCELVDEVYLKDKGKWHIAKKDAYIDGEDGKRRYNYRYNQYNINYKNGEWSALDKDDYKTLSPYNKTAEITGAGDGITPSDTLGDDSYLKLKYTERPCIRFDGEGDILRADAFANSYQGTLFIHIFDAVFDEVDGYKRCMICCGRDENISKQGIQIECAGGDENHLNLLSRWGTYPYDFSAYYIPRSYDGFFRMAISYDIGDPANARCKLFINGTEFPVTIDTSSEEPSPVDFYEFLKWVIDDVEYGEASVGHIATLDYYTEDSCLLEYTQGYIDSVPTDAFWNYSLEEVNGDIVYDTTPNGNHGQLIPNSSLESMRSLRAENVPSWNILHGFYGENTLKVRYDVASPSAVYLQKLPHDLKDKDFKFQMVARLNEITNNMSNQGFLGRWDSTPNNHKGDVCLRWKNTNKIQVLTKDIDGNRRASGSIIHISDVVGEFCLYELERTGNIITGRVTKQDGTVHTSDVDVGTAVFGNFQWGFLPTGTNMDVIHVNFESAGVTFGNYDSVLARNRTLKDLSDFRNDIDIGSDATYGQVFSEEVGIFKDYLKDGYNSYIPAIQDSNIAANGQPITNYPAIMNKADIALKSSNETELLEGVYAYDINGNLQWCALNGTSDGKPQYLYHQTGVGSAINIYWYNGNWIYNKSSGGPYEEEETNPSDTPYPPKTGWSNDVKIIYDNFYIDNGDLKKCKYEDFYNKENGSFDEIEQWSNIENSGIPYLTGITKYDIDVMDGWVKDEWYRALEWSNSDEYPELGVVPTFPYNPKFHLTGSGNGETLNCDTELYGDNNNWKYKNIAIVKLFKAGDYIETPVVFDVGTDDFKIELKVCVDALSDDATSYLFDGRDSADHGVQLYIDNANNKIIGSLENIHAEGDFTHNVGSGEYSTIILKREGDYLKIEIEGEPVATSDPLSGTSTSVTGKATLFGNKIDGGSNMDVRTPYVKIDKFAEYHFEETKGEYIYDHTDNMNHAHIIHVTDIGKIRITSENSDYFPALNAVNGFSKANIVQTGYYSSSSYGLLMTNSINLAGNLWRFETVIRFNSDMYDNISIIGGDGPEGSGYPRVEKRADGFWLVLASTNWTDGIKTALISSDLSRIKDGNFYHIIMERIDSTTVQAYFAENPSEKAVITIDYRMEFGDHQYGVKRIHGGDPEFHDIAWAKFILNGNVEAEWDTSVLDQKGTHVIDKSGNGNNGILRASHPHGVSEDGFIQNNLLEFYPSRIHPNSPLCPRSYHDHLNVGEPGIVHNGNECTIITYESERLLDGIWANDHNENKRFLYYDGVENNAPRYRAYFPEEDNLTIIVHKEPYGGSYYWHWSVQNDNGYTAEFANEETQPYPPTISTRDLFNTKAGIEYESIWLTERGDFKNVTYSDFINRKNGTQREIHQFTDNLGIAESATYKQRINEELDIIKYEWMKAWTRENKVKTPYGVMPPTYDIGLTSGTSILPPRINDKLDYNDIFLNDSGDNSPAFKYDDLMSITNPSNNIILYRKNTTSTSIIDGLAIYTDNIEVDDLRKDYTIKNIIGSDVGTTVLSTENQHIHSIFDVYKDGNIRSKNAICGVKSNGYYVLRCNNEIAWEDGGDSILLTFKFKLDENSLNGGTVTDYIFRQKNDNNEYEIFAMFDNTTTGFRFGFTATDGALYQYDSITFDQNLIGIIDDGNMHEIRVFVQFGDAVYLSLDDDIKSIYNINESHTFVSPTINGDDVYMFYPDNTKYISIYDFKIYQNYKCIFNPDFYSLMNKYIIYDKSISEANLFTDDYTQLYDARIKEINGEPERPFTHTSKKGLKFDGVNDRVKLNGSKIFDDFHDEFTMEVDLIPSEYSDYQSIFQNGIPLYSTSNTMALLINLDVANYKNNIYFDVNDKDGTLLRLQAAGKLNEGKLCNIRVKISKKTRIGKLYFNEKLVDEVVIPEEFRYDFCGPFGHYEDLYISSKENGYYPLASTLYRFKMGKHEWNFEETNGQMAYDTYTDDPVNGIIYASSSIKTMRDVSAYMTPYNSINGFRIVYDVYEDEESYQTPTEFDNREPFEIYIDVRNISDYNDTFYILYAGVTNPYLMFRYYNGKFQITIIDPINGHVSHDLELDNVESKNDYKIKIYSNDGNIIKVEIDGESVIHYDVFMPKPYIDNTNITKLIVNGAISNHYDTMVYTKSFEVHDFYLKTNDVYYRFNDLEPINGDHIFHPIYVPAKKEPNYLPHLSSESDRTTVVLYGDDFTELNKDVYDSEITSSDQVGTTSKTGYFNWGRVYTPTEFAIKKVISRPGATLHELNLNAQEVIDLKPQYCFITGGFHDVEQNIDLDYTKNEIDAINDNFSKHGITPVWVAVPTSKTWIPDQINHSFQITSHMGRYRDCFQYLDEYTTNYLPEDWAVSGDYLWAETGASRIGKRLSDYIDELLSVKRNPYYYPRTGGLGNILNNPELANNGQGWTFSGTPSFKEKYENTIVTLKANGTEDLGIGPDKFDIEDLGIHEGDRLQFTAIISTNNTDSSLHQIPYLDVDFYDGDSNLLYPSLKMFTYDDSWWISGGEIYSDMDMHLITPTGIVPERTKEISISTGIKNQSNGTDVTIKMIGGYYVNEALSKIEDEITCSDGLSITNPPAIHNGFNGYISSVTDIFEYERMVSIKNNTKSLIFKRKLNEYGTITIDAIIFLNNDYEIDVEAFIMSNYWKGFDAGTQSTQVTTMDNNTIVFENGDKLII